MKKIGLAVTGSFCTFANLLAAVDDLVESGFDITPIFSFNTAKLDTRFFKAEEFRAVIKEKTGKDPITTIPEAEPIGTSRGLELMLVAPCTGNTLAKIAHGITDTPVTMAVKAQLRNNRPVVLSISSNDALGANAKISASCSIHATCTLCRSRRTRPPSSQTRSLRTHHA